MSKKTFFKRIAVTAIAALGLGMLSVAPSQAVAGTPTVTTTAGSASTTVGSGQETSTAAKVTVTGLLSAGADSYTVKVINKTRPTNGVADADFRFGIYDTVTYTGTRVDDNSAASFSAETFANFGRWDSTSDSDTVSAATGYVIAPAAAGGWAGATFFIVVDSNSSVTRTVGTYVFTAIVTPYTGATAGTPVTADVDFVITDTAENVALAGGTIDPSKTTAYLGDATAPTADTANLTAVSTSSTTTRAYLAVNTYTSASLAAPESITVTITGPGLVGTDSTGVWGKSIKVAGDGTTEFLIRSDGTAGTASIVVATTTVTFPTKTMTFYAAAASTVEVSTARPVIGVGSTDDVVRATFKDASGNVWAGDAYIYASTAADALVGGSNSDPVACSWSAANNRHQCPVNGLTAGTANFKVMDADAVADATTTSDAVSVRVSTGVATTLKLSFDKETYAPGEKAQLRVSILDGAGLAMPGGTISNAFAASMTTSKAFASGSATITSVDAVLSGVTSAAADLNAGHQTYVVYMPNEAGTVTVTGIGGTGLAAAGRVAVTASASVVKAADAEVVAAQAAAEAASDAALEAIDAANAATDAANLAAEAADAATVAAEEARDAADAATAAVEALATEVATLMGALKAQITTLAKTVAKIAKKVKA